MHPPRLKSIDVFRALTMFLMVFVNDLWSLKDVPDWLEHMPPGKDGLGFSDIIFPAFLFIVGLSTPHAITNRVERGESKAAILYYIVIRSMALLVMGFFHVNLESYSDAALLPKPLWQILITIGFFLIWLDYPREKRKLQVILRSLGIILLITMAALYVGASSQGEEIWMRTSWWGILGLIGWAYFFSSVVFVIAGRKIIVLTGILLLIITLNAVLHLNWSGMPSSLKTFLNAVGFIDTTNISLVMGGIVTSVVYYRFSDRLKELSLILLISSILLIAYAFATRPIWGIAKLGGTPSWMALCFGISLITFLLLIMLVDKNGKENWFRLIKAAGTSTLTCYLLPYIHYALLNVFPNLRLPESVRTGGIGIVKSLLYALIIILITETISRYRIRLKV